MELWWSWLLRVASRQPIKFEGCQDLVPPLIKGAGRDEGFTKLLKTLQIQ